MSCASTSDYRPPPGAEGAAKRIKTATLGGTGPARMGVMAVVDRIEPPWAVLELTISGKLQTLEWPLPALPDRITEGDTVALLAARVVRRDGDDHE